MRGEEAYVGVSQGNVSPGFPDPDTGPVDQQSVVSILAGGEIELSGERAAFVIGNDTAAADGVVTVSGPGSMLVVNGAGNELVVGDEGMGRLVIENGAEGDGYLCVRRRRCRFGRLAGGAGTGLGADYEGHRQPRVHR